MTPVRTTVEARIFPQLAFATIREGEVVPYATWCALRAAAPCGSGRIDRREAIALIVAWRGLTERSARRVLQEGERAGYWRAAAGHLYLASAGRLLARFGLEREQAPHVVPLHLIRTRTAMKAHLYACCYEIPGHSQRFHNAALARSVKAEITSIPARTQRRLDAYVSDLVQPTYARVERPAGSGIALAGGGYFVGRGGSQWRRLADYRIPKSHQRAHRSAASHAMRKARALRERTEGRIDGVPVMESRGFPPSSGPPRTRQRRFYAANSEATARQRSHRDRIAAGAVLGWGHAGTMRFVAVEEAL